MDRTSGDITDEELARIDDAIAAINRVANLYSVAVTEVADPTEATTILQLASSSALGGVAEGTLGCEFNGYITIIQGWNWYTGDDKTSISANMFDFETIVAHELGPALGLGHSTDSNSVMAPMLGAGEVRRVLTIQDLAIPDLDTTPCGLHVTGGHGDNNRGGSGTNRRFTSTPVERLNVHPLPVVESGLLELLNALPVAATRVGCPAIWMGETRYEGREAVLLEQIAPEGRLGGDRHNARSKDIHTDEVRATKIETWLTGTSSELQFNNEESGVDGTR